MKKHFNLTKYFPFLRNIFINLFPKILDFTAFPSSRANVNLLIEERNTYFRYSLEPELAEKWNLELVNILNKNTVSNVKLIRIGPVNDGGYFIPDMFCQDMNWITIGLGFNFLFENELANKNCKVFTFDHTIPGRPKNLNPSVEYLSKGWGSSSESLNNYNLITLDSMLEISEFNLGSNNFWGLKFDIEGNEWSCLDQISKLSNKPTVIACELHGLSWGSKRYYETNINTKLSNLLLDYSICFANGNNYSPYFMTSKYGIYEIIELTLIRKDLIQSLINPNSENLKYISSNNGHIVQMPLGLFKS
jgi:hypothetical protein